MKKAAQIGGSCFRLKGYRRRRAVSSLRFSHSAIGRSSDMPAAGAADFDNGVIGAGAFDAARGRAAFADAFASSIAILTGDKLRMWAASMRAPSWQF